MGLLLFPCSQIDNICEAVEWRSSFLISDLTDCVCIKGLSATQSRHRDDNRSLKYCCCWSSCLHKWTDVGFGRSSLSVCVTQRIVISLRLASQLAAFVCICSECLPLFYTKPSRQNCITAALFLCPFVLLLFQHPLTLSSFPSLFKLFRPRFTSKPLPRS